MESGCFGERLFPVKQRGCYFSREVHLCRDPFHDTGTCQWQKQAVKVNTFCGCPISCRDYIAACFFVALAQRWSNFKDCCPH